VELSENCSETRPSYGSAPIWKGTAPLCMGAGEVSGGALCKNWSQSRRLLYTVQSREAKTEIPGKMSQSCWHRGMRDILTANLLSNPA
jgi:hypothetical protein